MPNEKEVLADIYTHNDFNITRQEVNDSEDIHDSAKDEAALKNEPFTIDLPDVSDIPGQENIHVPKMKEMADVTAASTGEEGEGLFENEDGGELEDDDLNDEDLEDGEDESNVTDEEKELLQRADEDMPTEDDINLRKAALDSVDEDGELLNEGGSKNDLSGSDLDLAGTEDDDDLESIGEEDEENNIYSLGGDNKED